MITLAIAESDAFLRLTFPGGKPHEFSELPCDSQ